MSKQIKLVVDDKMYLSLFNASKKAKLPISTFVRNLIATKSAPNYTNPVLQESTDADSTNVDQMLRSELENLKNKLNELIEKKDSNLNQSTSVYDVPNLEKYNRGEKQDSNIKNITLNINL